MMDDVVEVEIEIDWQYACKQGKQLQCNAMQLFPCPNPTLPALLLLLQQQNTDKACKNGHLYGCYHQAMVMYSNATPGAATTSSAAAAKAAAQAKHAATAAAASSSSSSKNQQQTTANSSSSSSSSSSTTTADVDTDTEAKRQQRKAAIALFDKTCQAGENDSCHFIAGYYLDPKNNVDRLPAKAVEYLERSCTTANHAPSCFNLAVLYRKGDTGVQPDKEKHEKYKALTNQLINKSGRVQGTRTG
jgi:TPR repeat protein